MKFFCINNTFTHCLGSCDKIRPKNPWVFNQIPDDPDMGPVLYTDGMIAASTQAPKRNDFGWMCESPALLSDLYSWVQNNLSYVEDRFIKIYTSDKSLLTLSPVFEWSPAGSNLAWVRDLSIRKNKSKVVSIIASNKRTTEGHILRHQIIESTKELDVYGRGHKPIERKEEGLEDYMFSYCVENTKCDLYYTEKIADAIACGTIPIYWGTDKIGEIFDPNGIIRLEDLEGLDLNRDLYEKMLPHAENNLEILSNMVSADDLVQAKMVGAIT